ncbi:hypothetical protein HDE_10546 [Halotydeus destructor]|nr:hypothetical protein HDE_10546 [Halotydeus destructor]
MASIVNLDDDSLLDIFFHLNVIDKLNIRSVCQRWMAVSETYNLFRDQISLGTVANVSCLNSSHIVFYKDTFSNLFCSDNGTLFKGKFKLDASKLRHILKRCPEVRTLVLKFCNKIDVEQINVINKFCPKVEHFDLSISVLNDPSSVLRVMAQNMSSNLVHVNILGCEGVDEDHLAELARRCTKLEELTFGRNGPHVTGRFLTYVSSDIRKVHIYGIDELANKGLGAITALSSGLGSMTCDLKVKGQLSLELVRKLAEKFPLLKKLELGDFFTDPWIDGTHTAIGLAIGQLSYLESLSFDLPELIQFDGNVLEVIRGCSQLKYLRMAGGPVSDAVIELIPKWCPFLEQVHFVYSQNFPTGHVRPTGNGLVALAKLKNLNCLSLNGTHLTDEALEHIVSSCHIVSLDVRDSPEITDQSLDSIFEAAFARPDTRLRVYIDGTSIDTSNLADIELPNNLQLIFSPRQDNVDDIDFEDEEFAYGSQYTEAREEQDGVRFSDMYSYIPETDGIRYVLEDLNI